MPALASFSAPSWQSRQDGPRTVWASWLKGRRAGAGGGKITWIRLHDESTTVSPASTETITIASPGSRHEIHRTRFLEGMAKPDLKDPEGTDRGLLQGELRVDGGSFGNLP